MEPQQRFHFLGVKVFLQCLVGVFALCLGFTGNCLSGEVQQSTTEKFGGGTLTVFWRPESQSRRLLLHFHGAPGTIKAAIERCEIPHIVATFNFNGLSAAYSQPFVKTPELYPQLLERIAALAPSIEGQPRTWDAVTLSTFSAGFGAVREVLRSPDRVEKIEALIAADSIYAGLDAETPRRLVAKENMQDFLSFARQASLGRKTFVISHTTMPTPYASTTETADYLLGELQLPRSADDVQVIPQLHRLTRATQGRFEVQGFSGDTGPDHMEHLRHIDLFWTRSEELRNGDEATSMSDGK